MECLEKIKGKNMGQNPDNVLHFLMKGYNYQNKDAKDLIEEALVANAIKSVVFNGKVAYRIVRTDSAADDTLFAPDAQESHCNDAENNKNTRIVEDTQIVSEQQGNKDVNISTILENLRSTLEVIDNRFLKIEDHLIGLSSKSTINSNSIEHGTWENIYAELLKK